jgi:molybdopterin converting factor small subunit
MYINVRLFATLRDGRKKEYLMSLAGIDSARDIIERLNIHEEEVAILLINGSDCSLNHKVQSGNIVSVFPPVGGG